ncbi:hypothetical protein ATW7_18260 [Alteromonadales bacterium TW-7]|nr:hypothetical protein ATW7_18260 [Alteromonadales bacterium TW-7]
MIKKYTLNEPAIKLDSDLAGEFPLYMYLSKDKKVLLYSESITQLLNDEKVEKPLKVSNEGLSFLLQSGVVPPPLTAYENIFILGIGDSVKVQTYNNEIVMKFEHNFPFMSDKREGKEAISEPKHEDILNLLVEETVKRIDPNKKTYLFHSAGKDSNSIVLALSEAGIKDNITLVTHRSKGNLDESIISEKIAKQLGFSHQVLHEIDELKEEHLVFIKKYFKESPFPCVDNLCLAYPLYSMQIPELVSANIIFGDGNDSHMISPPSPKDGLFINILQFTSKFSFLRNFIESESHLNVPLRTPSEWFGSSGFSLKDSNKIYPEGISVYPYWSAESKKRRKWDLFYFKSDIYSTRVISEKMMRKLFNFSTYLNANIVLPFAAKRVAKYFSKVTENHLFDRKTFKNKMILRDILKERMNLDSDEIGKMGWSYDTISIVLNNWDLVTKEIYDCSLWERDEVEKIIHRLRKTVDRKGKYSEFSCVLIYRLYLLSMWKNKCKYLNEK